MLISGCKVSSNLVDMDLSTIHIYISRIVLRQRYPIKYNGKGN
jgi:hypothetical protein